MAQNTNNADPQPINNDPKNEGGIKGFDGITWGTTYNEIKERFIALAQSKEAQDKVEIISDIPNREILIQRKDILYRYVFYKKPSKAPTEKKVEPDLNNGTDDIPDDNNAKQTGVDSRFFFVESIFPLVATDDLYKKLTEKYGDRTNSTYDEKQARGAYVWDLQDGLLVQWIEAYEKKPYTRSLYYVSKTIREEIKKDLQEYNYQREIKTLNSILP